MKTLALAYPHNGTVHECFMKSYVDFREFDLQHGDILGCVIPQKGMYIAGQRNVIVRRFLETRFEWLLSVDTDHAFEPQVPYLMIQSAEEVGARVMSALYFGVLAGEFSPMWWQHANGRWSTVGEINPGVQRIDGCGFGMCLVHRSVLEEMRERYVDDPWKWFGHDLVEFEGQMQRFGEDLCFCARLSAMGVSIYGDSRIIIGHEKTVNVDYEMFMKLAKLQTSGNAEPADRVIEPVV